MKLWFLAIVLVSHPLCIYDSFSLNENISTQRVLTYDTRQCERCPKIVELEFNSTEENLTIIYGDKKTKKPLSISKFDYSVKYEIRDANGRLVFTHTSSDTSLILNLKQIEDSGVYHLFIRPGRLGIMQYQLLKK